MSVNRNELKAYIKEIREDETSCQRVNRILFNVFFWVIALCVITVVAYIATNPNFLNQII